MALFWPTLPVLMTHSPTMTNAVQWHIYSICNCSCVRCFFIFDALCVKRIWWFSWLEVRLLYCPISASSALRICRISWEREPLIAEWLSASGTSVSRIRARADVCKRPTEPFGDASMASLSPSLAPSAAISLSKTNETTSRTELPSIVWLVSASSSSLKEALSSNHPNYLQQSNP